MSNLYDAFESWVGTTGYFAMGEEDTLTSIDYDYSTVGPKQTSVINVFLFFENSEKITITIKESDDPDVESVDFEDDVLTIYFQNGDECRFNSLWYGNDYRITR